MKKKVLDKDKGLFFWLEIAFNYSIQLLRPSKYKVLISTKF